MTIYCRIATYCYTVVSRTYAMKDVLWNGNIEHVQEHGLSVEDVEHVLEHYVSTGFSRSSDLPCVFGYTPDGTYIIVIYEDIDEDTIYPVTAYEVDGG